MRTADRRIAATSGLRSVPVKQAGAKLRGVPAHINPDEDRLLRKLLPESHGRVLTSGRLAKAGRLGDDRLTLVSPREAKVLKRHGGSGAINPATGLREFEDDKGDGNPGGGHNADGPASSGGYGGPGATSDPGSGPSSLGGGIGPGGFFSAGEDLSKESEIGGPGAGRRGAGFDPENNPEMGGGRARAAGLASVAALGPAGRDVMSARAVMAGLDPSFADRALDFTGYYAPGGIPGSRMANLGATIAGGLIGGPLGAAAASVAHNTTLGGISLADTAPAAVGGLLAGGLGSLAASTISGAIRGKESYESPMTQNDRARRDAALDAAERNGKTGSTPGAEPGTNDGAGAGTAYVMAPPEAAAVPAASAPVSSVKDTWDEAGFLTRNPEVGKAVKDGIWTSGRSFNAAYKAQAGANYDSAKALGLVSPYRDDMLAARPGVAVAYKG